MILKKSTAIVRVATIQGINVDVVPGQTTPAVITAMPNLNDDDDDGVSNLDELDVGTDPASNACIIDNSLLGNCTLG